MHTIVLRRVQRQLQTHDQWLRSFAVTTGSAAIPLVASPNRTSPTQRLNGSNQVRSFQSPSTLQANARKQKSKQSVRKFIPAREDADPALNQLNALREAIEGVDVGRIVELYPAVRSQGLIDHTLTWRISQCIHEALRRLKRVPSNSRAPDQQRRDEIVELVAFGGEIVKSIRKADIAPDRRGHVHLLGFFKEAGARDDGIRFWEFLEQQDEEFVDSDVYGAALDLLAVNGTPLAELETLYQRALERFPGSFVPYHFSPNAIVADREKATSIKGISMTLLQGIMTARILHGDSKNAYMAFDTALRLYPDLTPARFFTLLINERPTSEGYTVFAMACRSGVTLPFDVVRKFLTTLRAQSDPTSIPGHVTALRQVLAATYLYLGVRGVVSSNLVNEIVIAFAQILRLRGIASLEQSDKKLIVDETLGLIRTAVEIFARFTATPGVSAFNSIIVNLAGYGQSKQILAIALKDMQMLGLEPNHVTRRSMLMVAGMLEDPEMLAAAWEDLVQTQAQQGVALDAVDYHILVKSAKQSKAVSYAAAACENMAVKLRQNIGESLLERLYSEDDERVGKSFEPLNPALLMQELGQLRADLGFIDRMTTEGPSMQDFSKQSLPMTIAPTPERIDLPEEETRRLYDATTTEPAATGHIDGSIYDPPGDAAVPGSGSSTTPNVPLSSTGLTFGTLRYENWESINYLLALSQENDAAYHEAVDKAIAKGVRPPTRNSIVREPQKGTAAEWVGLSDVQDIPASQADIHLDDAEVARRKQEILRLRGLTAD